MARKKAGSRVAAGQQRAKERAKRRARSGGPSLPESAYAAPAAPEDLDQDAAQEPGGTDAASSIAQELSPEAAAPSTPAAAVRRPSAAVQRRARQAAVMAPAGSLKREIALIGSITAVVAAALAALKLATSLGA